MTDREDELSERWQEHIAVLSEDCSPHDEWGVRTIDDYCISVLWMGFNWRIVLTKLGDTISIHGGWCYPRNQNSKSLVLAYAHSFNPTKGEEPIGWIKEIGTGRTACISSYPLPNNPHSGYNPDCKYCGLTS